ncbi:MAG: hypothetical protein WD749_02045 [Phycisphaerales bacterium]
MFLRWTYKTPLAERAREFAQSAAYLAFQLRLDFADLILAGLKRRNLTQKDLGGLCGRGESFISRYVNSKGNCTFGVVARILFALGIRPKLVDADEWEALQQLKKRSMAASGDAHARVARIVHAGTEAEELQGEGSAVSGRSAGVTEHHAEYSRSDEARAAYLVDRSCPFLATD